MRTVCVWLPTVSCGLRWTAKVVVGRYRLTARLGL
jgi:hypothetical protein